MKVYKITFLVLLIISLVIFSSITYKEIFLPAYVSVVSICSPENVPTNWHTIGELTRTFNETTNISQMTIKIIYSDNGKTLKHELVHYNQNIRPITFRNGCYGINIIGKYIREVEAYIGEELPDSIFELVYGKISNSQFL